MESKELLLHKLPDLVLVKVLEKLDIRSLFNLQRVCRDLHDFIEETRPKSSVTEMTMKTNGKLVLMKMIDSNLNRQTQKPLRILRLWYVPDKRTKKISTEEEIINEFCDNFKNILQHQKYVFEKFSLHIEYNSLDFLGKLEQVIREWSHPFQVKNLMIQVSDHNELIPFLSLIDSNSLETIEMFRGIWDEENLTEIAKLDQWKRSKELKIHGTFIKAPMQLFAHFSKVYIRMYSVTLEMVKSLKEIFLNSSNMNRFEIYHNPLYHVDDLNEVFGRPYEGGVRDNENEETQVVEVRWFFRIPDNNKDVLNIRSNCFTWFTIIRVKSSNVPDDAFLIR